MPSAVVALASCCFTPVTSATRAATVAGRVATQGKDKRAAAIESGTGSNVTDFVAADGSNNIAITADVADVGASKSMLASPSPEVLAAMQDHGVAQPITAYIQK